LFCGEGYDNVFPWKYRTNTWIVFCPEKFIRQIPVFVVKPAVAVVIKRSFYVDNRLSPMIYFVRPYSSILSVLATSRIVIATGFEPESDHEVKSYTYKVVSFFPLNTKVIHATLF